MKQNFINTSDLETRNKLLALGFTEIENNVSGVYTFLNNKPVVFENEKIKVTYSNTLCI